MDSGARYVVQIQWDWYPSPQAFGRDRHPEVPRSTFLAEGEDVSLAGLDEDVAMVAPSELEINESDGHLDLASDGPASSPLELRSARGTTAFDCSGWHRFEATLLGLADQALTRPRTGSGVLKLAGVADALILDYALACGQVDDVDDAVEALDLFTARLGLGSPVTPLEAAFLCRAFDRTGDADLLSLATKAIVSPSAPVPGLGLAATQLCLGLLLSGRPVEPVLAFLARQAASLERGLGQVRQSVTQQAAALELLAVTRAGPGASGASHDPMGGAAHRGSWSAPRCRPQRAGGHPAWDVGDQSPHHGVPAVAGRVERASCPVWGCSAHELASRATPELLARLIDQPISDAHAWLILGRQTS